MASDPSACRWCRLSKEGHLSQWHATAGWHPWTEPTIEQRYKAIRANAAERRPTPASGMPHTPAQGAREYLCPRCDRWAKWTDGETDPVEPTFWCQTCSAETPIRNMDSRLQGGRGDAETSGTGSDRGTGVSGLQISTQTLEGDPLTGPEISSRTLALAFGTRVHDRAFIREISEALDAALRPVHFREAAAKLRLIVDRRTTDSSSMDGLIHNDGIAYAAERLERYARDLDDEAGR